MLLDDTFIYSSIDNLIISPMIIISIIFNIFRTRY